MNVSAQSLNYVRTDIARFLNDPTASIFDVDSSLSPTKPANSHVINATDTWGTWIDDDSNAVEKPVPEQKNARRRERHRGFRESEFKRVGSFDSPQKRSTLSSASGMKKFFVRRIREIASSPKTWSEARRSDKGTIKSLRATSHEPKQRPRKAARHNFRSLSSKRFLEDCLVDMNEDKVHSQICNNSAAVPCKIANCRSQYESPVKHAIPPDERRCSSRDGDFFSEARPFVEKSRLGKKSNCARMSKQQLPRATIPHVDLQPLPTSRSRHRSSAHDRISPASVPQSRKKSSRTAAQIMFPTDGENSHVHVGFVPVTDLGRAWTF